MSTPKGLSRKCILLISAGDPIEEKVQLLQLSIQTPTCKHYFGEHDQSLFFSLYSLLSHRTNNGSHILYLFLPLFLSEETPLCAPDLNFCFDCTFVPRTDKMLKQSDAHSMPAERILVFRSRSRSYLGGIFLPSNFSGAPPRASASTNEDGGRVVASAARRLRP